MTGTFSNQNIREKCISLLPVVDWNYQNGFFGHGYDLNVRNEFEIWRTKVPDDEPNEGVAKSSIELKIGSG